MIYKTIDGNEACAISSYLFFLSSVIYPITPSSPMAEHIDDWSKRSKLNLFNDTVKVIEMNSEAGAAGAMHGALRGGCLASTYTASQGLLLMIPNMYKIAGEMLPGVIHVASRSIATHALSILGDHQDIYATRQTGFAHLSSSNVQEVHDLTIIAHLAALKSSIPFLHFFDGFRTSHELSKIEVADVSEVMDLLDYEDVTRFRNKALNIIKPRVYGTAQNDDIYFQATEVRNKFYDNTPDIVNSIMKKFNEKFNRNYKPFEYYGDSNAKRIIIAMGSVCDTIKLTVDDLNKKRYKVGLVIVHLYRPFSKKYLIDVLPKSVAHIAVLDRTKEPGSVGEPLYLDVLEALKGKNIDIIGGRYGLSSKNTTPKEIKSVFDFLDKKDHFTSFTVGIDDDVTNKSIKIDNNYKIYDENVNMLIYGYGSDGMISASKTLIKIIGDNTSDYVQGYFQYDSRKSGGMTKSHLRFSKERIRNTYYVDNPDIVVVSKETYLKKYDVLENIKINGIFILNTSCCEEDLDSFLPDDIKRIIKQRNIRFYIIDAHKLSKKYNLNNKINTAMTSAIFKITDMLDYEFVKDEMKKEIYKSFAKKSMDIVDNNYNIIDKASDEIKLIDNNTLKYKYKENEVITEKIELIKRDKGDMIPVSAFLDSIDGGHDVATTKNEKRCASLVVPHWIKENCIQCNQCSLVCPHGVIRPYLVNEEEVLELPEYIDDDLIKAIGNMDGYKFTMGISIKDCTGCMLCVNTCPGKNGESALIKSTLERELRKKEDKKFDYLDKNITEKRIGNKFSIKGSQFIKPKFEFSGACSGCGETPYIKLLTQLFGDKLIIANATGCSSIYGASTPSIPYSIPWANSLFEDNAEFGYGILIGNNIIRNRIKTIMKCNLNVIDDFTNSLFTKWLDNPNDYDTTKLVYDKLNDELIPDALKPLKDFIPARSVWTIGGDGWAYDIGYNGIDHVLSTNDNVRILVLDTEVYSNTGGQASKSTNRGAVAKFASSGKTTSKKDLVRACLAYKNVYVATISLGANMAQAIKAMKEAEEHNGPSIIIAYSPCISHGIKCGMNNSIDEEKLAVQCGYFPLLRYDPINEKLHLDYKNPNFDKFYDFLNNETRFRMLKSVNKKNAEILLEECKMDAIDRFSYYEHLAQKE